LEAIVEYGCGLDVHQATVVACLLAGPAERRPRKETRTFGTTTSELEEDCHTSERESAIVWGALASTLTARVRHLGTQLPRR
jgi:hypothetical protein